MTAILGTHTPISMSSLPRLAAPLLALLPLSAGPGLQDDPGGDPLDGVRRELSSLVQEGAVVGALAVVERDGELVLSEGVGTRDGEAPMREDTIFRIYSMTKPITCAGALILYDEGRFDLDDPVAKYLPELAHLEVEGAGEEDGAPVLRVRDLFQHTSGWSYQAPWRQAAREAGHPDPDLRAMVNALAGLPLEFSPGTRWEYGYSNDVLGRLIEVLSGTTFDRFLEERVFEPLGMVDTGFSVDADDADRLARLYGYGARELEPERLAQFGDSTLKPAFLSGGGGLFSTLGDYLRFLRAMLAGGELDGVRILRPETVAMMTRDQIDDIPRSAVLAGRGFGLGVAVVTRESERGTRPGTWSWGGAAGTSFWVDPEGGEIGIFMAQNWMDFRPATRFQTAVQRTSRGREPESDGEETGSRDRR